METPVYFRLSDGILLEGSGHIECPPHPKDEDGTYAVKLWHDAMELRYRRNDILFVNPNLTATAGEDAIVQVRHRLDDASKLGGVGFVREIVQVDYELDAGLDGSPQPDTDEVFLWAHNLQDKGRNTYNGDFKSHRGCDPLERYEGRCEQSKINQSDVKFLLIVGVKKASIIRHNIFKINDAFSMKAEVGQAEIKVEQGSDG